jgi:2-phosphoglycerate kinase
MRGILVQSLVSRGIPFDVALEAATKVRDRVAKRGRVDIEELSMLVDENLEGFDLEALPLRPANEPPLVLGHEASVPFSKGLLAVSLQGAGLDPSDAHDVARELEARLLLEGRREIERSDLRELVSETIERGHGARAAERYRIWRQALGDGQPIFVLLGGSTGVGKTSIAVEVARRLEISRVIGTDSIRQIMRLMFSPDLMPEIHCSTYDAYQVLRSNREVGSNPVIVGYREQAEKIAVGVHALLDRAIEENTSMVLEGVNLLPGILQLDHYRSAAHVIFVVTATLDVKAYRSRFSARAGKAKERAAERYLDHFEEILSIQEYILTEADHYGLPIVDNVDFESAVLSVIRSVNATLRKSMVPREVGERS